MRKDSVQPAMVQIRIHGKLCSVPTGTTVAAALWIAGQPSRISVSGSPRTALCGMGICFECRAVVNGGLHRRTCQMLCEQDMVVETSRPAESLPARGHAAGLCD